MSEQKHAGGRPALPPGEKRQQWDVRLTPAAIAVITEAAALDEQPPRTWAAQQLERLASERLAQRGGPASRARGKGSAPGA